jgi:Na+/H+-dicarboxylate symporter
MIKEVDEKVFPREHLRGGVPIGSGFFRGMQMLVVSLVLCSLVCGAIAIGGSQKLGNFFCSYLER